MLHNQPIIVVDDDPDDLTIIKEICKLLKIPNKVVLFDEAEKVLNYLKTEDEQPFLILCDINMPKLNGLELRGIINNDEKLRSKGVPFVFLSTIAIQSQVDTAYQMTVQGFFEKGTNFERLRHKIQIILEY